MNEPAKWRLPAWRLQYTDFYQDKGCVTMAHRYFGDFDVTDFGGTPVLKDILDDKSTRFDWKETTS
jgi:hypothetical protein